MMKPTPTEREAKRVMHAKLRDLPLSEQRALMNNASARRAMFDGIVKQLEAASTTRKD